MLSALMKNTYPSSVSPLLLIIFVLYIAKESSIYASAFSQGPVLKSNKYHHTPSYDEPNDLTRRGYSFVTTSLNAEAASICIIGAGVSGLAAAISASKESSSLSNIILLEASNSIGGRVQSDQKDGYILDQGFAVFIEAYPFAKQLLDYESLNLKRFLPGALVKIKDSDKLERVSDPLRIPSDIFTALLAPIGSLLDKILILKLVYHVRTKSIEDLFAEPETDTLTALKNTWNFITNVYFCV
jgi:Flavin containing amine oxidoreductase